MSKTAQQWSNEGQQFWDQKKLEEALNCFKQVVAIDPNFQRGDMNIALVLADMHRHEEAVQFYDKAIQAMPNNGWVLRCKGNSLLALRRLDEALETYNTAIKYENNNNTHSIKGSVLEELGRTDEALQCYDYVISQDPIHFLGNQYKADLLYKLGRKDEAIHYYDQALKCRTYGPHSTVRKAAILMEKGEKEKAMELYNRVGKMVCVDPLDCVERGRCYSALGRDKEALEDFKEARRTLPTSTTFLPITYMNFIKETLTLVLDTEDIAAKNEELVKTLDVKNPAVQKFVQSIQLLRDNKEEVQKKIIEQFDHTSVSEQKKDTDTLESIKRQFEAKFAEMQAQMAKLTENVKQVEIKVAKLENELDLVKEELNNKLDDFKKKLAGALAKQDLKPEDIASLTQYFNAFLETFGSIYVTSQVVDSGQVQLDSGNSTTSVLSFLASFTPFIGGALSEGITSVGEFLQTKEMKKNARKIKGLASDCSDLSQTIGQAAYDLACDTTKQSQICAITEDDLSEASNNMMVKLKQLMKKASEDLDVFLYSKLYKTPAARLGHNDANSLIEKWVKDEFGPFGLSKQLVNHTLGNMNKGPPSSPKKPVSPPTKLQSPGSGSACCNMF